MEGVGKIEVGNVENMKLREKVEKISNLTLAISEILLGAEHELMIADLEAVKHAVEKAMQETPIETGEDFKWYLQRLFRRVITSRPDPKVFTPDPAIPTQKILEFFNALQYLRSQINMVISEIDGPSMEEVILNAQITKYAIEILLDIIAWHYRSLFKVPKEIIEELGGFPQDGGEILNDEVFKRVALFQETVVYARDPDGKILKNIRLVREPGKKFFKIVIEEELPDRSKKTFVSPKDFNLGVLYGRWVSALRVEAIDFKAIPYENPEPYYKGYALRIVSYTKSGPKVKFSTTKNKLLLDFFITKDGQAIFTNARDYTYGVMDPAVKSKYGARAGENVIFYTDYQKTPVPLEELRAFLGESEIVEEDDIAEIFKVPLGKYIGYLVIFRSVDRVNIVGPHPRITIELPPNKTILIRKQQGYPIIIG